MKTGNFIKFISVLIFLLSSVCGLAQQVKVNVTKRAELKEILSDIEDQTGYTFLFNQQLIDVDKVVRVRFRNEDIDRVIHKLFRNTDVVYTFSGERIILTQAKQDDGQVNERQNIREISGKIVDREGKPIPGASILEKGTYNGTISDINGHYSLTLTGETQIILYRFIGMYPVERAAVTDVVNVTMDSSNEQLDEIVVIGYGTALKSEINGAISKVAARDIEQIPATSYEQALSGHVSGVQIRQSSGTPGGGSEMLIRGINSIKASNAPLIIIDGFPFGNYSAQTNNLMSLVNPGDIESISVIRDASGKAIYGSRASGGLIIITTKKGKIGKPRITVESYMGLQTIPNYEKPNVLNATELATFHQERFIDDFKVKYDREPTMDEIPAHVENPQEYGEGTNWYNEITRNSVIQNYNLRLEGGTADLKYAMSLGYLNQDGVVIETNFKLYCFRANLDADINKWLHLNFNVAPSWSDNKIGPNNPGAGQFSVYNTLNVAQWADPSAKVYDENGNLNRTTKGELTQFYQVNPVLTLKETQNTQQNRQILASASLKIDLLKGVYLKFYGGTNYINNLGRTFKSSLIDGTGLEPSFANAKASNHSGRLENLRLVSENTLNFERKFDGGRHKIKGVLGYTAELTKITSFSSNANRLIDENFYLLSSGNVPISDPATPEITEIFFNTTEGINENSLISYLGRINYTYADKYYFTGVFRRDGSSRFGPNNKFANFPSFSVAWKLNEENWFPHTSGILSSLKLETSYGLNGNNGIGNYSWQGGINKGVRYVIGDSEVTGSALSGLPNYSLQWEKTQQLDLGLDIGLFEDRLILEADYYRSVTKDLLYNLPLPTLSGFSSIISNIGSIENKGFEFNWYSRLVSKRDFSWMFNGNISINRNKVLQLGEADKPIYSIPSGNSTRAGITEVGSPVGMYYGLKLLGLYTPEMIDNPEVPKYGGAVVGAPYYLDADESGTLDIFNDYVVIGNPWPDFTYGFNTTLTYKLLSLRLVATGEYGSEIFDSYREFMINTDRGKGNYLGVFNVERSIQDRYRVGDNDYSLRTPTTTTTGSSQRWRWPNNMGVVDGSYLKISNITLAYDLKNCVKRIPSVAGGNVYVSIQNALVFSPYHGNPEIGRVSGSILERNVNYSSYPVPRVYTLGFKLTL